MQRSQKADFSQRCTDQFCTWSGRWHRFDEFVGCGPIFLRHPKYSDISTELPPFFLVAFCLFGGFPRVIQLAKELLKGQLGVHNLRFANWPSGGVRLSCTTSIFASILRRGNLASWVISVGRCSKASELNIIIINLTGKNWKRASQGYEGDYGFSYAKVSPKLQNSPKIMTRMYSYM